MKFALVLDKRFKCLLVLLLSVFVFACAGGHRHIHEAETPKQFAVTSGTSQCKPIAGQDTRYVQGCKLLEAIATTKWEIDYAGGAKLFQKGDILKIETNGVILNPLEQDQSLLLLWVQHDKGQGNNDPMRRLLNIPFDKIGFTSGKDNELDINTFYVSLEPKNHVHGVVFTFKKVNDKYMVEFNSSEPDFALDGTSLEGHVRETTHRDSGTGAAQ